MASPKLTILLADDVQLELQIEKTFLQRSGFKVITAKDGQGALALALSDSPDLIVLDQVMPGMNGTEVCRALRARKETREIPILITSNTDSEELRALCAEVGANQFVPKSAGRDALLQVAAKILRVPVRRSIRLTVFFLVQEIVGAKETLGKGVDLSEGGMGLETTRHHSPGSTLRLRFMLPGERQEHKATGRVISASQRSDGTCLLGVEFTEISDSDRKRLNQYLDKTFLAPA